MGGTRTADGLEVLYARSRLVLAARATDIVALDQVFAGIKDDDGFRRDAMIGRTLGYTGKLCVTPRQAQIANEIFVPSEDEILRSRRVIATYAAATANGRGAIGFAGTLVDEPMVKRAEAIVAMAERRSQDT